MQDYVFNVVPLMPTHIIKYKARATPLHLAKDALRLLKVQVSESGQLSYPYKKIATTKYDHISTLAIRSDDDGVITITAAGGKSSKQDDALRFWIRCHGAKSLGKGRYQLSDKLKSMLPVKEAAQ